MNEEELDNQLMEISENDNTKGERYFGRKFKSAYYTLRKSLVVIAKNRKALGSQKAVEKTRAILERVLEDLN